MLIDIKKNPSTLIYINRGDRIKVPGSINRFLKAGITIRPASTNRRCYKYRKLGFLLHLLSLSHSLPPQEKGGTSPLPFSVASRAAPLPL